MTNIYSIECELFVDFDHERVAKNEIFKFERLANKWKKDELEYYLDISKSKDFYEFGLPTSTRAAFQVDGHNVPNDKRSRTKTYKGENGNYVVEIDDSIKQVFLFD